MPVLIGLTGGIACGKSLAAHLLEELGAEIQDTDRISRDVTVPGSPVLARIVERWGPEVLQPDGTLDRKRLGEIVFGRPEDLAVLNSFTHPAIFEELRRRIAHARREVVVVVVPLLYETGAQDIMDEVWVVAATPEEQRRRLMERDGLDAGQADARIANQWPVARKAALAKVVLDNNGAPDDLRRRVGEAWQSLQARLHH